MGDKNEVIRLIKENINLIEGISDFDEKVEAINDIKRALHKVSPFKYEPVDCVIWVKGENVEANSYNPNSVAPPEMELLAQSILEDGYTQPIVSWNKADKHEVVDGFHRNRVGKENKEVNNRIRGYLPLVAINSNKTEIGDRMSSTIRHNRARGKHNIDLMSNIVVDLKRAGWSENRISKELGMCKDEILRLSQISGLFDLFVNNEYSKSW